LVRAVDSIAANLSEGMGRYHTKEIRNFTFYARGSAFETKTWLTKAMNRKLITKENGVELISRVDEVGKMINGYLNSLNQVSEPETPYGNQHLIPNTQYLTPKY
jgi:four helix bundle protein